MTHRLALILLSALLALTAPGARAGDPGRLEADAEFLLGEWANDCSAGAARIFLSDGALRQQGLLRLAAPDRGAPVVPITLLAATRDGVGLHLDAATRINGVRATARYAARVVDERRIDVKSFTICRDRRCRTTRLDVPWKKCSDGE